MGCFQVFVAVRLNAKTLSFVRFFLEKATKKKSKKDDKSVSNTPSKKPADQTVEDQPVSIEEEIVNFFLLLITLHYS